MDIQVLGEDDEPTTKDKIKETMENDEDIDVETEQERDDLASYIDDQISQARTSGRMEAETRGEDSDDILVKALLVNTAVTLAIAGLMTYQWYF